MRGAGILGFLYIYKDYGYNTRAPSASPPTHIAQLSPLPSRRSRLCPHLTAVSAKFPSSLNRTQFNVLATQWLLCPSPH
jgi:hypothetical protein